MTPLQERVREHLRPLVVGEIATITTAAATNSHNLPAPAVVIGERCLRYPCQTSPQTTRRTFVWEAISGMTTNGRPLTHEGLCLPLLALELFEDYRQKLVSTSISYTLLPGMPVISINSKCRGVERWFPCSPQFAYLISQLRQKDHTKHTKQKLAERLVFGPMPDIYYAIALRILMDDEAAFLSNEAHPAHGKFYPADAGPDSPKELVDWTGLRLGMPADRFLGVLNGLLENFSETAERETPAMAE